MEQNTATEVEMEIGGASDPANSDDEMEIAASTSKAIVNVGKRVDLNLPKQPCVEDEDEKVKRDPKRFVEINSPKVFPSIFYVKTNQDHVTPIDPLKLFTAEKLQNDELTELNSNFMKVLEAYGVLVTESERQHHFNKYNMWQAVPTAINYAFKTNLLDMDSVRFYEALLTSKKDLWPTVSEADKTTSCVTYDVLFLCPQSGGAATGTIMYLDINQPQLRANWKVFTRHPWKEGNGLHQVVASDNAVFWEKSKWKFVLNDDLTITTNEEVEKLVNEVKSGFRHGKVDLVIGDLSPSLINMEADDEDLCEEVNNATLTEAGQIELALRTLKDGGHLLLSLVNPTDVTSSLGNAGFLAGLFSTVAIVLTRQSSTWIQPSMLVCSGYVGVETFETKYPNFSATYLRSINENIESGERVMLDTADFLPSITTALVEMAKKRFDFEGAGIRTLVDEYRRNFMPPEMRIFKEIIDSFARDFVDMLERYVTNGKPEWRMYTFQCQNCDVKMLELIRTLWEVENEIPESYMNFAVQRLRAMILNDTTPNQLCDSFKDVPVHKPDEVTREVIPTIITFSRFTSLDVIYDHMIARKIGFSFPITGSVEDVEPGTPQRCRLHTKETIKKVLASEGVEINVEEGELIISCVNFSTFTRLTFSDGEIHQRIIETLLSHLSDTKVLKKDDTLFVCMLPLISRLLLGSVSIVNKCFSKTYLVLSKEENVAGVLFKGFRGHESIRVQKMKIRLTEILADLDNPLGVEMEIISFESMFKCSNLVPLMLYNDTVIGKATKAIVNYLVNKHGFE